MKKRMLAAAVGLTIAMTSAPGWAGNDIPAELMQELQALKKQNRTLMERIDKLERMVSESTTEQGVDLEGTENDHPSEINDKITLNGLIEAEATGNNAFDGTNSSDISLATVELALNAAITDWTSGHILLKYEDGANLDIDEGTITLGNTSEFPLYLTVGKMYVPFGDFTSNMVSDPLTLELGETNEDTLQIGFEKGLFYGSIYGFNGAVKETGKDDMARNLGANLGFGFANDNSALDTGIGWISNIGESNGLSEGLALGPDNDIQGQVGGLSAHLSYNFDAYGLIAEYVKASDSFAATELNFNGRGAKPSAWNLELSTTTNVMERETTFAIGLQGSKEATALGFPETRYLGSVNISLMDYTNLALEYIHDKDYKTNDGGTGDSAQSVTMQLAVEF